MGATKIRMNQFKIFEKINVRNRFLRVYQIFDPENIKTVLCNDEDRQNCCIMFSSKEERDLYGGNGPCKIKD